MSIRFLAIAHLVVLLCRLQPLADQIHICPRRPDSGRRLLLKSMQHVNRFLKTDGIDRPEGSRSILLDDLRYAGPEAFPRLGRRRTAAELHHAQGVADVVDDLLREFEQVSLRRADPEQRLLRPSTGVFALELYL